MGGQTMVSSPPIEVLSNVDDEKAYVSFTAVGNDHVEKGPDGRIFLDSWALRVLARQAEQHADRLDGTLDE